jgi:hypothetical protein
MLGARTYPVNRRDQLRIAVNVGKSLTLRRQLSHVHNARYQFGSYKGRKMLFLGLGTGLGSTLIGDGIVEPMELGHLPFKKNTYEDYLGEDSFAWASPSRSAMSQTS